MDRFERSPEEMRAARILPDYTQMAAGSVLIECGRTRVICTASIEEGVPPFLRGSGKGWLTAEYAMLPGATPKRKPRDGVKRDGRSVEIQRLIGRSLRAACDLSRLGERTITIDCDVIQADGGTRTAAITGGFAALCLAVDKLLGEGAIQDSPVVRQLAAVSVGVVDGRLHARSGIRAGQPRAGGHERRHDPRGGGEMKFVEVQGSGERARFSREELDVLLSLAEKGVVQLMDAQRAALGERAAVIGRKPKLALASNNFGKLRELKQLLGRPLRRAHHARDGRPARRGGDRFDV